MARDYFPGMGQAVADRTINRKGENWGAVAARVAAGNAAILGDDPSLLRGHLENATILMSGRHLQHGDLTQPGRNIEVFTNCSTASQRSIAFYLLLNGSGVGTSYDDDICLVDFRLMPQVICTIREDHPDRISGRIKSFPTTAEVVAQTTGRPLVFMVPDSREGWAEAVEEVETAAFRGDLRDRVLILDFSSVREYGAPIGGMQGRPASGPGPLMEALRKVALVRDQSSWAPWRQAMQIDHELAECVLVGGARRSARIAVKTWSDPGIFDFINVKQDGSLWSANNSIGVDRDFWAMGEHAKVVFEAAVRAQYEHGTGEPGFLNLDMLAEGESHPTVESALKMSGKYRLSTAGLALREALTVAASKKIYCVIVNPCGEIRLHVNGGYCVIADVVPFHAQTDEEAADAFRQATIALLRTNLLPALYQGEVERTNRIGVGMTGLHEFAWKRFALGWRDMVAEHPVHVMMDANGAWMAAPSETAWPFWQRLADFAAVVDETIDVWCEANGANKPASRRTFKPAGTTSKLFGLTEGAHLPAMREYLRWVQFRDDDPIADEYEAMGYPVRRNLQTYKGVTLVGFPTAPAICALGMGDALVTAAEATPEEQFRFLRLLETFWLGGGGNQISYTLKYDPAVVDFPTYADVVREHMPLVRAVSVMPQIDGTAYEYQPEEPITRARFEHLMAQIASPANEDVDQVHVDCASGACPIDFSKPNYELVPEGTVRGTPQPITLIGKKPGLARQVEENILLEVEILQAA